MFSIETIKTAKGKDIIIGIGKLEIAIELDFNEMRKAFFKK
jgi:hypothetical protein